ncbi:3',5'-cyclic-nucleotide phosphodiesterase [Serendipita sp. 400]|nr:3',5'-cyclic-nucleotide phosphodiesterase [Serendipita sp. 400]
MSEAVYHHDRLGRRNWDEGSQAEDERQGQEPKELSLNERWGPVTVLIEKKDVLLANSSARRASLTPSLTASTTNSSGAPGEGGGATSSVSLSGSNPNHEWEAWNSRSSTSTITPSTMTMNTTNPSAAVAAMSGNSNRRQRTSTTMHASLHVPHSLVASLSSLTIVQIQPQLFPLPTARPLLLLIQLADYVPQELSTTTSSICFPPNVTPSPKSIQRALLPLHTVLAQLDAMTRVSKGKENARKEVALMVYSDNAHLPPEISETAFNDGAHGLLTPPFTRASVEHAIHMALEAHARASSMMDRGHYLDDTNFLSTQTRSDDDPPYQTPRPSFYTPFQPSPLSFSAPQDPQKSNRYTRREYAPDERDGVDPLDVTKPFEDMSGHGHQVAGGDVAKVTSKSRDTRPSFPVMEPRKERRASVDLGGLALTSASSSSLNPSFSRSFPVPSSPPSSAMSQDFESSDNPPRISEAHVNENGWRTRAGSGWAGWDSAFVNEEKEGSGTIKSPGKGNQVGKARVRRRSVPPFDEGGELEVAQLVMSMYLHSTSALANASSPLFSNRHQQTLSQSTQASTSSAFSNHSLHHQPSSSNLNALSPTSAASQLSLTLAPHSFNTNEPHHIPPNSSGHPAPSTPPAILPPSPRHSARLLAQLSSWNFEPYILNSVDAANCVILLFSIMLEAFGTPADQSSSSSLFPSSPTDEGRVPLSSITSLSVQKQIAPFIHDLQKMYRKENRYHSFVHALDVLQAVWMFLQGEGRVPPLNPVGTGNREVNASAGGISIRTGEDWAVKLMVDGEEQGSEEGDTRRRRPNWRTRANEKTKLGERMNNGKTRKVPGALGLLNDAEVFLLCLAAIGHDVGHPGNGNAFLKNAHAPLSRLYDDKSALERMHCTLLLRLLKKHGMGHLVSPLTPQGREGRWLVIGTILATDMSWHFEWLEKFGRAMKERRLRLRYLLQMQQTSRSANPTGNHDAATAGDDGESENETQMDEPDLVESRLLASMSPWQVSAVPMSSGNKAAGGRNTTGTGTSVSGSGTSRVWSRSRPESVSSSSTLSSVPGSAGGNNGGERGSTTNLPKTPTLSSSGYGKSPISPVVSPFSASGPGFFNSASTAGPPGAVGAPRDHHHQRNAGFNSIWDVDPDVQEECWMDLLRSWEKRDGRKQNQGGVGLSVGDPTTSIATADSIVTGREVITLRTRTVSLGQGPY